MSKRRIRLKGYHLKRIFLLCSAASFALALQLYYIIVGFNLITTQSVNSRKDKAASKTLASYKLLGSSSILFDTWNL
jgi:hypothetical protein